MRVELPYKVRVYDGAHGAVTRFRDGTERRVGNRYFATFDEAATFAGNPRRVIHAPGEAFTERGAQ